MPIFKSINQLQTSSVKYENPRTRIKPDKTRPQLVLNKAPSKIRFDPMVGEMYIAQREYREVKRIY
jgi:hypothetical protein